MIITSNSRQVARLFVKETNSSLQETVGETHYRVIEVKISKPCLERRVDLLKEFHFCKGVLSFEEQMERGYLTRKLVDCFQLPGLICIYVQDEPYRYCFFKYQILDLPRIDINCASIEQFVEAQMKLGIRPEDVIKDTRFNRIWGGELQ